MKVAVVQRPGDKFTLETRDLPEPGPNQVRVRVHACGICHGDVAGKEGHFPGVTYPRVVGHEFAGVIDKVGQNVLEWKEGDRIGVGWHAGHCFQCNSCRRGDFAFCKRSQAAGLHFDGGYGQYAIVPIEGLAKIPDSLSFEDAAPMMCAGLTTYNSLRNSIARAGDLVAIQGIGGLGHLGIQFANKMGFKVAAISSGEDKRELATKLGAHYYINTSTHDPVEELNKLGGATVVLATAPHAKSISPLVKALAPQGKIILVGAPHEALEVSAIPLIMGRASVQGWASGTAVDAEDTLQFAAFSGIRSLNEVFPLEQANEAYERMITNKARFRVVLKP